MGIKKTRAHQTSADIHPQSHPAFPNHLFFKTHRTSLDILDVASLDGVLEVNSAERARARVLALDRVGGAIVLVLVGAGTFAYLVELGVHVAGGVC